MSWLQSVRDLRREWHDAEALLAIPEVQRRLVVYSEDVHSYNQFQGYIDALIDEHGQSIAYVTSAADDPLLEEHRPQMVVFYVNQLLRSVLSRLQSDGFVVTAPDLGNSHFPRPANCQCVYVFHSLASVHEIYRPGAFDHYDAFFCTGPHHRRELERYFAAVQRPTPALHEVGYYKLDRVVRAHAAYAKRSPATTVLLAPSWGDGNVLEAYGEQIVERLLSQGLRVIVRPHPCFLQPIYPRGREVVERLSQRFADHPAVEIERDINTEDAFHEADLMISDFSGAAYEYALGTLRPVLFVDVPRKTRNSRWRELGLPTFEDTMRQKVGKVIAPSDVPSIDKHAAALISATPAFAQQLQTLRTIAVYNLGNSARVGAQVLNDLLSKRDQASTLSAPA